MDPYTNACIYGQFTFHRSLAEKLADVSTPSTSHFAVTVTSSEQRFHKTTTNRFPDRGPAHTWNSQIHVAAVSSNDYEYSSLTERSVTKFQLSIEQHLNHIYVSFCMKKKYKYTK